MFVAAGEAADFRAAQARVAVRSRGAPSTRVGQRDGNRGFFSFC